MFFKSCIFNLVCVDKNIKEKKFKAQIFDHASWKNKHKKSMYAS